MKKKIKKSSWDGGSVREMMNENESLIEFFL
jgi:hypothetical protein